MVGCAVTPARKRSGTKQRDMAAEVADMTDEEIAELQRRFPEQTWEEYIAYQRSQGKWPKEPE